MQAGPSCGCSLLNWWPWPESRSPFLYGASHSRRLEACKTLTLPPLSLLRAGFKSNGRINQQLDYCPKHTPADTSCGCNCNGRAKCIIRKANLIKSSKHNRMWSTESSSHHATCPVSRLGVFPSLLYTHWWKKCSLSYLNNSKRKIFLLFSSGIFCRFLVMHKIIIIDWPPSA